MKKKDYPVYQVSSDYADCLEKAFVPESAAEGGAASEARPQIRGQFLGAMGNTPLESSPFGRISEDTVHLSVWAEWGVEKETLFSRLHRCQLEARGRAEQIEPSNTEEGLGELDFDPDQFEPQDESASSVMGGERYMEGPGSNWFEFGKQLWRVKANGIGGKDGRSYYPFAIHAGGILIGFRRDKHETVSNMWIEMGSIPLAQHGGLEGVWKLLSEMFKLEGIHVEKDIVSRVDIYTDFPEINVSEFCDRFHNNQRVTRARKIGYYVNVR